MRIGFFPTMIHGGTRTENHVTPVRVFLPLRHSSSSSIKLFKAYRYIFLCFGRENAKSIYDLGAAG